METKRSILVFAVCLLLLSILYADGIENSQSYAAKEAVIVDSLIAVDQLTGSIFYQQNYITVDASWMEGATYIGDYYDMGWMVHFASISYLSFGVPIIPEGYQLKTAVLVIYVFSTTGNSYLGEYPVFNNGSTATYPDGILEHIDYGSIFNSNDVIPTSIYGSYTLFSHSSLVPPCLISYDVTDCLISDLAEGRSLNQYRIYLQGFSDWDNRDDFVAIGSHSNPYGMDVPKIHYTLTDGTSNNDPTIPPTLLTISCYPNPFIESSQISIKLKQPEICELKIFNTRGQLIKTFAGSAKQAGEHIWQWDGKDENGKQVSGGIYLAVVEAGKNTARSKIIFIK
jgi:hypothetical protein